MKALDGKKRQTKNTHHKSKLARIDRHFPWQAWHLQHWTGFGVGPLVVAGEFFTHHLYHLSQTIVPCNCFNFSILHHPVLSIFLGQNGPIHPYHIGIPQASQPVPQQLAETEKRYMELQAVMATLGQRTLAESRLKANQPDQKPDGTTDSPAPKQADTGLDTQDSSQPPPTKLSAQTLTAARPTPPPPPPSKEQGRMPRVELSDPGHRHPGAKKLPQPGKEQPLIVEVNAGPPPILSPTDSPDTLTSETVVVSSPAPDQEENFDAMDMATLQSRRLAALETVQDLTAQLFRAQDAVSRITKRLKTMQESQATPMPPAHPREDIEIEGMD